jgi:hypothetical protein
MNLIYEDAGLHSWIIVHRPFHLFRVAIEDAHSLDIAAAGDWTDDRKFPFRAKLKIPTAMFPDNLLNIGVVPFGS